MLLEIKKVSKNFGGVQALSNIDLSLKKGEIHGIIGPNGSGKSTLFNVISGIYPADKGAVIFDGQDVTHKKPHEISKLGIARTFQLLRLWSEMTVVENVKVGFHCQINYSTFSSVLGLSKVWKEEKKLHEKAMDILEFVGLAQFASMPAAETSGGQRRLIALARVLAMRPKILMLDEPVAGLSPVNVDNVINIILKIKEKFQLTLVIVEHILKVVMESCQRVTVLDHGEKIAEGAPADITTNEKVIEAYLGKKMDNEDIKKALRN